MQLNEAKHTVVFFQPCDTQWQCGLHSPAYHACHTVPTVNTQPLSRATWLVASHAGCTRLSIHSRPQGSIRQVMPSVQLSLCRRRLWCWKQVQRCLSEPSFTVDSTWCSPCLSSDDQHAVAGSGNGSVFIWQVPTPVTKLPGGNAPSNTCRPSFAAQRHASLLAGWLCQMLVVAVLPPAVQALEQALAA